MNYRTTKQRIGKRLQRGFTLIELMIVVAVLGVLMIIFGSKIANAFVGSTRATSIAQQAEQIGKNIGMVANSCGTGTDVTNSGQLLSTASAANMLELTVTGSTSLLKTAMVSCYNATGVKPMSDITKTGTGTFAYESMAVTITGGGNVPLQVAYANVPTELAEQIFNKYNVSNATFAAATANSTDNHIRYTAASSGVHTVTVLVNI